MSIIELNLEAQGIQRLISDLQATPGQVNQALNSTLRKMASWLRTRSVRGLSSELKVQQKLVRRRLRTFRLQRTRNGANVRIWYGLDPISVTYQNMRAKQDSTGVRAGQHRFPGAFMGPRPGVTSTKLRGGAFKRRGRSRLPIDRQRLEIADKAQTFLEDQVIGGIEFEQQFYKTFEHELLWRMRTRK